MKQGYESVFEAALSCVENYRPTFDYCGDYPECLGDSKMSVEDGKEEFYDNIEVYKERYSAYYEQGFYNTERYKPWGSVA